MRRNEFVRFALELLLICASHTVDDSDLPRPDQAIAVADDPRDGRRQRRRQIFRHYWWAFVFDEERGEGKVGREGPRIGRCCVVRRVVTSFCSEL